MVTQSMLSIDEQLNSLLVELNRSLLQYLYECSPYVSGDKATKLRELAEAQQQDVGVLCDVLTERHWAIDFGTYPTDYTAIQYNSLSSLAEPLKESQSIALRLLNEVAEACSSDAFVSEVLVQLKQNEESILEQLVALVA